MSQIIKAGKWKVRCSVCDDTRVRWQPSGAAVNLNKSKTGQQTTNEATDNIEGKHYDGN